MSGIWYILKYKKMIPKKYTRNKETNSFRKSIVEYIKNMPNFSADRDVDLAPENSKRWKEWLILFKSNKKSFFKDKKKLKEQLKKQLKEQSKNKITTEIYGGYKTNKRKSRGRKSRGRKSRGRKSRGIKSRGIKSRGRKSRGIKSHIKI